jgi:hypothetical protein
LEVSEDEKDVNVESDSGIQLTNCFLFILVFCIFPVTPMQSICDQLLYEHSKETRELQSLKFVWTERDPVLMQEANFVHKSHKNWNFDVEGAATVQHHVSKAKESMGTDITSTLLSQYSQDFTPDEDLANFYTLDQQAIDEDERMIASSKKWQVIPYNESYGQDSNTFTKETGEDEGNQGAKLEKQVVDIQVYLTGQHRSAPDNPYVRLGRPNIKKLFMDMKREAIKDGETIKVAVCVCAPRKLTQLCQKACIVYSDNHVRFDFHSESME